MGAAQAAQIKHFGASFALNMTQSSLRSSVYSSLLWSCWCSVSSETLRAGVARAAAGPSRIHAERASSQQPLQVCGGTPDRDIMERHG